MAISKVIYTNENGISSTWMDVTSDTVTSANLLSPNTATKNDGTSVTGSIATKTSSDLSASGATVTAPAGYYATNASKSVASGSAATPATSITANPTISVNSSTGVITATTSASQSVTPTVSAGYVSSGTAGTVSVSGSATESLTTQAAQTIYPSTSDQSIASGKYLTGAQTIKGVLLTNLSADNIKKDVVVKVGDSADDDRITSVTGTYEGGGGGGGVEEIEEGVQFIDYDGTLVETWKTSTVASKTALPSNPSHTGLTAQGWNWSLTDIKSYIASYPTALLTVGQMYVTASGATEIDCEFPAESLHPYIGVGINGTIDVDWGDGSAHSTITGTSYSTIKWADHVYSVAGSYTISLAVTGTMAFTNSQNMGCVMAPTNSFSTSRRYSRCIRAIRVGSNTRLVGNGLNNLNNLATITIPQSTAFDVNIFVNCHALKSLTWPDTATSIPQYLARYCYSLTSVAIPASVTSINNYAFQYCTSLKYMSLPPNLSSLGSYAFGECRALLKADIHGASTIGDQAFYDDYCIGVLIIGSSVTSIAAYSFANMYSCGEIHFKSTLPPTVNNSNAFTGLPTNCKIYVPSGYLSAYTTASNYPSSVTYTYVEE